MSGIITTFPFTNPANYTAVDAEVSTGFGRLDFIPRPSLLFNQSFDSGSGFTFDSVKTEFASGLMRQKDQRGDATFYANYNSNINGVWGAGSLTGVATGGAAVAAGKLDLSFDDIRYVTYDDVSNFGLGSEGAIRFKVTPNYSGTPTSDNYFFALKESFVNANLITMFHRSSDGVLLIQLFNSAGVFATQIMTPVFNPTAGVELEFEFNFDAVAGAHRLFIDGVQFGVTETATFTRTTTTNLLIVGTNQTLIHTSNFKIDDFVVYDQVQNVADYTPGLIPQTIYGADTIDLPDFDYTAVGAVQSLDLLAVTEVSTPLYTVEGQYFDSVNWVSSDGSPAQANTLAVVNTNFAALVVAGQLTISMQVVFRDSNTLSSVDAAALTYTGQQYPLFGTLLTNSPFVAQTIEAFDAVLITPLNTEIRFIFDVNGQDRWHDGADFANSDGTPAESNTLAELQAVIAAALADNASVKIKSVLITTDQQVTPEIDSLTVEFNFGALEPATPLQAQVFGFIKDIENNPIVGAIVKIKAARDSSEYVEAGSRVIGLERSRVTDANGFFTFNLITSSQFESKDGDNFQYVMKVELATGVSVILENDGDEIFFTVPDVASINITDQIVAV